MRKYPDLLNKYNEGRGARNTANFFGGVTSFFIGWPIGQSMSSNSYRRSKTPWWMLGVGAGFTALAIPINNNGIKKMKSAFKDYNGQLGNNEDGKKVDIQIVVKDGVGFRLLF